MCVIQGGVNSIGPYDIDPCPSNEDPAICALTTFTVAASSVPTQLTESFSVPSGPVNTSDTFTLSTGSSTAPGLYAGSVWTLTISGTPPLVDKPNIQVLCSVNLGTCATPPGPNAVYQCLPQPPEISESTGVFAIRRKPASVVGAPLPNTTSSPTPTPPRRRSLSSCNPSLMAHAQYRRQSLLLLQPPSVS